MISAITPDAVKDRELRELSKWDYDHIQTENFFNTFYHDYHEKIIKSWRKEKTDAVYYDKWSNKKFY